MEFLIYMYMRNSIYHTRAIISRGLYIFYPIFKDHFFVFKEVFSENSVLMYGLYSRAAYDGARTVCILCGNVLDNSDSAASLFLSSPNGMLYTITMVSKQQPNFGWKKFDRECRTSRTLHFTFILNMAYYKVRDPLSQSKDCFEMNVPL